MRTKKTFRSGLEAAVIENLKETATEFEYETLKIKYQKKPSTYTPDLLLGNGVIIEVKGYFDTEDRTKHLLIQEQHPELDIRFVFQASNKKIHKSSPTTYADWCEKHNFKYADKVVPIAWIKEIPNESMDKAVASYKPKTKRKILKD